MMCDKQNKPEILAPAGNKEGLLAALRCGADAVYLGFEGFNARANASNFSREEMKEALAICHIRGGKAYVTLNTLAYDQELPEILDLADYAVSHGADAIIVQDIGLLRLLHERYPGLPLHASTQCSVQTAPGMALLRRLGAVRAVVPRECGARELERLLEEAPVELEVFVHGALCVSVSGQCRMSLALGGFHSGRSGNRGSCAQPCRLLYTAGQKSGALLSLKDLSLLDEVARPPLSRVAAFKIEGRQKRPEYIAAAVAAFRDAMDGSPPRVTKDELRQAFSRSGFTQGYYHGKRDGALFGARQKNDIAPPELLRKLAGLYEKETPRIPLTFHFAGAIGQPVRLTARARGQSVTARGGVLQTAETRPITKEEVMRALQKLGGTPYFINEAVVELPDNAFLPLGEISALRREAVAILNSQFSILNAQFLMRNSQFLMRNEEALVKPAEPIKNHCELHLRAEHYAQLPEELPGVHSLFLPAETPPEMLEKWREKLEVAVTIPAGVFDSGEAILAQLRRAREAGVGRAMAQTLDGVALALEAGMVPVAGEGMNLCNSESLRSAAALGVAAALCSVECGAARLRRMEPAIPIGTLVYGRLSLMLCRVCPVGSCGAGDCHLVDRMGAKFPLRCRNGCTELFNSRPLYLLDRKDALAALPLSFHLIALTTEGPEECAAILRAYQDGTRVVKEYTRALYTNHAKANQKSDATDA
ncbi:MAG: U32 family peptidase [Oscillospiraceae bacterium]|nr:U32 family peptidase [Oscillospiraceae bacterium]